MVKKLQKMADKKAAAASGLLDNQIAAAVKDSAQQIWLAGMGAFSKAQAEGGKAFEKLMVERRVRPSALHPLWNAAGFALGAATALMGPKAAMACTVAVEEVIDQHYRAQSDALGADEAPLKAKIDKFRGEELQHRDAGLAHGAEQAPAYPLLTGAIKAGSRLAIWLAERI